MSAQSRPAAVSSSTVPYQSLSNITDNPVKTPSHQRNDVILASTTDVISSNNDSDNDDNDGTKNRGRM